MVSFSFINRPELLENLQPNAFGFSEQVKILPDSLQNIIHTRVSA
jgi:hypothetical protein